jgi:hypothetical protein
MIVILPKGINPSTISCKFSDSYTDGGGFGGSGFSACWKAIRTFRGDLSQ